MLRTVLLLTAVWCFLTSAAAAQSPDAELGLRINEFMASNVLSVEVADGDYPDWIEIYNPASVPVDLSGYGITDQYPAEAHQVIAAGAPDQTTVPAQGFLVLYADGQPELGAVHLDFGLSAGGDQIVLIGRDGVTVIDSVTFGAQVRDHSHGRSTDEGGDWVYFDQPTAGAANGRGYTGFAAAPIIVPAAGVHDRELQVSTVAASAISVVRYTLDGSVPDETDPVASSSGLRIDSTTVLRARAFAPGVLPSETVTSTFLIAPPGDLPILALTTDPDNLLDPDTGILLHDEPGRAWERPAEIEFYEQDAAGFRLTAGLRIQGNTGPADYDKKSFRLFLRKGYGTDPLEYRLFPQDSVTTFSRLVLRSGYDDSLEPSDSAGPRPTLLRDPLVTELWRQMGGLTPQSRFVALYLNGAFEGIYDIKQNIDTDLVRDHLGFGDLDLLRTRWDSVEVVSGSRQTWDELIGYLSAHDLQSDGELAQVATMLDLGNYTDLQALVHGTHYARWAYGVSLFREQSAAGRWQWTVWDADRAFTLVDWNGFTTLFNPLNRDLDSLVTRKLLANPRFRRGFVSRHADLLNSVLSTANVTSAIDSLAASVRGFIPLETNRWGSSASAWEGNVSVLRRFARERPDILRQQLQEALGLDGQVQLTINVAAGAGTVRVNSLTLERHPWSGTYFRGVPVAVKALPAPGYRFAGWSDPSLPQTDSLALDLSADRVLAARFVSNTGITAELIAPATTRPGRRFPFVVRLRNPDGTINYLEQTPIQVSCGESHPDTSIAIKRGAGTGTAAVDAASAFVLSVENVAVPRVSREIQLSSVPVLSYAGELPPGEVVWDSSADRLVTEDVTVPKDCHLIIEKGTWVLVRQEVNFMVYGRVTIRGTASEPVIINSEGDEPWGGMEFHTADADFRYCMMLNGGGDYSKGRWHTGHQHIIYAINSSVVDFDHCFLLYSPGKAIGAASSRVTITNTVHAFVYHGGEFPQVLLFLQDNHYLNLPNDDQTYLRDIDTDGLHIDFVHPSYPQYSVIDRCFFVTGKDDAIDQLDSRLIISNCWLEDFEHEGVAGSVGDTVRIFNTVALNNGQAFEAGYTEKNVADGPNLFIDHCVAVDNDIGLRIGDEYDWDGRTYTGHMTVTNTVLYNNRDNIWNYVLLFQAPLEGAIDISYSMTNDVDYDGCPGCITGVPQFDAGYFLLPTSAGVGIGTNGTNLGRADSTDLVPATVVISEIMYNPHDDMDGGEWVELYNPGQQQLDLSAWSLRDSDDSHVLQIPSGAAIAPKGYGLLCADAEAMARHYPGATCMTESIPFRFGDTDAVRLYRHSGGLASSVAYSNSDPWPGAADGDGFSLEFVGGAGDNGDAANWRRSLHYGGSPGHSNPAASDTAIDSGAGGVLPLRLELPPNYPNPFNGQTVIAFSVPADLAGVHVELAIYNELGQQVITLLQESPGPGHHRWHWDGRDADGVTLASGVYVCRLRAGQRQITRRMVLLR
jgi:hypothetical protein